MRESCKHLVVALVEYAVSLNSFLIALFPFDWHGFYGLWFPLIGIPWIAGVVLNLCLGTLILYLAFRHTRICLRLRAIEADQKRLMGISNISTEDVT